MDRHHGSTSFMHGSDEGRSSRKDRLMGKLFKGRERKTSNELQDGGQAEINDFLHGTSSASSSMNSRVPPSPPSGAGSAFDTFQVNHATPPQLAKLDTRKAMRYPNALPLNSTNTSQHSLTMSQRSRSPPGNYGAVRSRRSGGRRGLVVRFVDTYPDIIGEGGDESEIPPAEIGRRRRARAARPAGSPHMHSGSSGSFSDGFSRPMPQRASLPVPPRPPRSPPLLQGMQSLQVQPRRAAAAAAEDDENFTPGPIRRTQTGYSSISGSSSPGLGEMSPSLPSSPERKPIVPAKVPAGQQSPAPFLDAPILGHDENRRSFIEVHQAEMRQAEGLAFANAIRDALRDGISPPSSPEDDRRGPLPDNPPSPIRITPPPPTPPQMLPPPRNPDRMAATRADRVSPPAVSPPSVSGAFPPAAAAPSNAAARSGRVAQLVREPSPPQLASPTSTLERAYSAFRKNSSGRLREEALSSASSTKTSQDLQDIVAQVASDEAFDMFAARTRHLFELFRLHSETFRPLSTSPVEDLARAALWWFIIGRMALEKAMRERSAAAAAAAPGGGGSPVTRANEFAMQQAYADLAKSYWLVEEVMPERLAVQQSPYADQVAQTRSFLLHNLRKLAMSMKRNELLPPEDAFLPQTIDKAIWATYPAVSSDITMLLWGQWGGSSLMAAAGSPLAPPMTIFESLPVSDNAQDFVFSRVWADAYLMEQGRDVSPHQQQRFHFPCIMSVLRPKTLATLEVVLASQNGAVQLRIQGKKNPGPTWDDVRWRSDVFALELRMPRGFVLAIQLSKPDYGLLWSMYDFGSKVHSQLYPRKDEQPVFRSTLKAFQYFESGHPTGSFPKEAVPECDVALFEKVLRENAATGPRHFHRGFRLAVVSGTTTRTLYGASHSYLPEAPVQFSFLRGDHGDPALLLRFETNRSKGSMVLSFGSEDERIQLHNLLAGTAIHRDEHVVTDAALSLLYMLPAVGSSSVGGGTTSSAAAAGGSGGGGGGGGDRLAVFKKMAFKQLRVINRDDEADDTLAPTVLAEQLRVVFEYGDCTVADRINVAPGELKIRLNVRDSTCMSILRQPQQDMTVAVSDVQVPREMGRELIEGLRAAQTAPTVRVLRFPSLTELHAVQAAMTGYRVAFDGVASTFAIARRRMVVPIHKKWEAGTTRIQVVVHPDTKITQLLAFFQDFHYGRCMSFVLKGTDVFESFGRSGKAGIKIDDAKFPLPRMPPANEAAAAAAAVADGGPGAEGGIECHETAYVCLDMPDLPGEHDDISILFEKEADRDRLASCLPAPVRGSRLAKMF